MKKKVILSILIMSIILIIIIIFTSNETSNKKIFSFGGSEDDFLSAIAPAYNEKNEIDGCVLVGNSSSINAGFSNNGGRDAIIIKYNMDYNQEWIKNFGGSSDDYWTSIALSYDINNQIDGYILVGRSDSSNLDIKNNGFSDAIIAKYDLNGEVIWQKSYGSKGYDNFNNIIISRNSSGLVDGYIAVGMITSSATKNDAVIIKYNLNGEIIWEKVLNGKNDDYYISVIQSNNSYIAVGYSSSTDLGFDNNGLTEAIIVKYDLNGNKQLIKTLGGNSSDEFRSISLSYNEEGKNDGYIIVGRSDSNNIGFTLKSNYDAIITKYDFDLNQEWINSFGGSAPDALLSVIAFTNDENKIDGYIAAGYSESTDVNWKNMGNYDGIVVKYKLDGEQEWLKNHGGNSNDSLTSIANINNKYIISGYSNSSDLGFKNTGKYDGIIIKDL